MMVRKRFGTAVRHDQIAEAALDIVRLEGVRRLNVAAVAKRVGLVPSAVYRHFNNKGEIVDAVLALIQTRLNENYQRVIQQDLDPIEKLRMLLHEHVTLIADNNAIPRIVFSEEVIGGMPEKQQQLHCIIQDVLQNVSAVVAEGQKKGVIRGDMPAENIAVSFFGMIQPAAVIWNLSQGAFDLVRHSQNAWKLFLKAVQRKP